MSSKPPVRWTPSKGSPFARRAFPPGGGYRPQSIQETTGVNAFGRMAPPVGAGPVEQSNPGPPVSWVGQWRPTEAELARWGGRVVLYGPGVPENAETTTELDVLDATLPWPMACDVVVAVERLGGVAVADIDVFLQCGVGRASWKVLVDVPPPATQAHQVERLPYRQISVRARWRNAPGAGEVVAVSVGFGVVGV